MKTLPICDEVAPNRINAEALPSCRCTRRALLKYSIGAIALSSVGLNASCSAGDSQDGKGTSGEFDLSGRPRTTLDMDGRVPIVWIEAGICTGCAVALLGSAEPTIETVLPSLRLEFQETLMDRSGTAEMDRLLAVASSELANTYLLIVDGAIPAGDFARAATVGITSPGVELTAQALVTQLAQRAAAVVAMGTCAAFGGIAAANPNPANHRPVADFVPPGVPLVRIPGCPPHPTWILETLTTILTQGVKGLSLDPLGRPLGAFGGTVHDACPRRGSYDAGEFAEAPGDPSRCLFTVGCKGPDTHADCPKRLWGGRASCIQANHPCIGCAAPGFPDARSDLGEEGRVAMTPIYS